jgi:hypothetical protein
LGLKDRHDITYMCSSLELCAVIIEPFNNLKLLYLFPLFNIKKFLAYAYGPQCSKVSHLYISPPVHDSSNASPNTQT